MTTTYHPAYHPDDPYWGFMPEAVRLLRQDAQMGRPVARGTGKPKRWFIVLPQVRRIRKRRER